MNIRPLAAIATIGALTLALSACVPNAQSADESTTITVNSSATACEVSATEAPSGTIVFEVTNTGDEVTEFYLLAGDGQTVKGEVENVGPGISRNLVISLEPGEYVTACKPGMVGTQLGQAAFTVTDS